MAGTSGPRGCMKGAGIREILRWYERQHGRAALGSLASECLSAELIDAHALVLDDVALGLIASRWYPPEMIHAMLDGMFGGLDEETARAQMREATTAAVRATGRGVYRFALERVVSPRLFAASIQVLWNMIHDSGVRSMIATDRAIESRTHDWLGHGPLLCDLMAETSAAVLETMGNAEVRWRRDECVAQGDACCLIHYSWA